MDMECPRQEEFLQLLDDASGGFLERRETGPERDGENLKASLLKASMAMYGPLSNNDTSKSRRKRQSRSRTRLRRRCQQELEKMLQQMQDAANMAMQYASRAVHLADALQLTSDAPWAMVTGASSSSQAGLNLLRAQPFYWFRMAALRVLTTSLSESLSF